MKNLRWLGDSRSRLKEFPAPVRDDVGYALYIAQRGGFHHTAKPMHGLGSGVMEIVANDSSGTYRAVYTVSIGESVYVVHAFQKKAKTGYSTPKGEMDIIRRRIKLLRQEVMNAEED